MFMDLAADGIDINVTSLTTASTAGPGEAFSIDVFTRPGSALGGGVAEGPGSSPSGWTSLGTTPALQSMISEVSEEIDIPDFMIGAGTTVGLAIQFNGVAPRYFGTGTPPYEVYSDGTLTLVTGDSRSVPFTTTGSFFSSRALVGSITYSTVPEPVTFVGIGLGCVWLAFARRKIT